MGMQAGSDPFTAARQAKKGRMQHNDKQQMGNLKTALKTAGPGALPTTLRLAAALPEHGKGHTTKHADRQQDVRHWSPTSVSGFPDTVLASAWHPVHGHHVASICL